MSQHEQEAQDDSACSVEESKKEREWVNIGVDLITPYKSLSFYAALSSDGSLFHAGHRKWTELWWLSWWRRLIKKWRKKFAFLEVAISGCKQRWEAGFSDDLWATGEGW